jgi:hypothetical protein
VRRAKIIVTDRGAVSSKNRVRLSNDSRAGLFWLGCVEFFEQVGTVAVVEPWTKCKSYYSLSGFENPIASRWFAKLLTTLSERRA